MSASSFDQLQTAAQTGGTAAAFEHLAQQLIADGKYHDLFDARLMEARHGHGLPAIWTGSIDDLAEPTRSQMEEAYLAACREIGRLLLAAERPREAWMYLRPVGDKAEVSAALEKLAALPEPPYEQIIELALQEGINPPLGFQMVLNHFGVCNAITMFDSEMQRRPRADRQAVAALLVRRLHHDLSESLRGEITRQAGSAPAEETIGGLVADREWLFDNNNYHIDTSHLNAVVRFALSLDDPEVLRLAHDLTEYGRRLSAQYQFAGAEPFKDVFPSHALFFQALLGNQTDEALDYFRTRADQQVAEGYGETAAAEVYVALLARVGQHREALDAAAQYLPAGVQTSGFAPSLLELGQRGNQYARLLEICRDRDDLLGFAAGLVDQGMNR